MGLTENILSMDIQATELSMGSSSENAINKVLVRADKVRVRSDAAPQSSVLKF
jgi:hypothetical protein